MASSLEVESSDVVKLMLQFMKENNLVDSMRALQHETEVSLNAVDNLETFISDIQNGKWDVVLGHVQTMRLPTEKMILLYEQVIFELLEAGERLLAREVLRSTPPLAALKTEEPERYLNLEHLCQRTWFNATDVYALGSSKERRRQDVADALSVEVVVVPPSRLLALIGQAMRFQQSQGQLPKAGGGAASSFDLFRGARKSAKKDTDEKVAKKMAGQIRFSAESHPETAVFSPDGQSLITGSMDGFIEVWDFETCKLRKDLDYQAKDELMMHEGDAVLCSAFSRDAEHLVTGSQSGAVKVWKVSTGVCLRKFAQAHPQGVTSVSFSRDGTQILTTSFDHTIRLHGIKSGKTLKEFRGHSSYVNSATFTKDGINVLSASSDGTVKLWDSRTVECLLTFRPGVLPGQVIRETTVHTIQLNPAHPDHVFVCNKSSTAYLMTAQGQVVRTYSSGKVTGGDFLCATISPQGKWVYCVGEDGVMYVFDVNSCQLEHVLTVTEQREVISVAHHPLRNLIVTLTDDGQLRLWRP